MKTRSLLTLLLLLAASLAFAQQDPNLEQGLKPYGSYHGGDIDTVGLSNGNLMIRIPIISYPQRGKLSLSFSLMYNDKHWEKKMTVTNPETWGYVWKGGGVGIVKDNDYLQGFTKVKITTEVGDTVWDFSFNVKGTDGSTHQVGGVGTGRRALDGSGFMSFQNGPITSGTVVDSDGTRYSKHPTTFLRTIEDTNGNKMTLASAAGSPWIDSLGRSIPVFTTSTTTGCPSGTTAATAAAYPAPNGTTATVKVCTKSYTITCPFTGEPNTSCFSPVTPPVMANAVLLPDGTSWLFGYNSAGDLSSVTLPTGGTLTYTWGSDKFGSQQTRVVLTRTVNANDGTGPHAWTYNYGTQNANPRTTTVTDPDSNQVTHAFTYIIQAPYETTTKHYNGAATGTPLKTVVTAYTAGTDNPYVQGGAPDVAIQIFPTSVTTSISSKTAQATKTYDAGNTYTFTDMWYSTPQDFVYPLVVGSVVQTTVSDWGTSPNPGAVLRKTVGNYLWQTDSTTKSNNLLNLVSSAIIQDGSSNRVAETDYGYDQTSVVSSGVTTQLNIPPTATKRGNQTTVSRWLTGATFLNSTATYFDTGMVQAATDPGGHATTFAYETATLKGACPTGVTMPNTTNDQGTVTHTTSVNYDFNTGLLTSSTDQNGQLTTFSYDSSWRLSQRNTPDSGQVNWAYTSTAPFKVTVTSKITSTMNKVVEGEVDGLGRVKQNRLASDPEGTVYTDTTYDNAGRVFTVTNPYRTGDAVYVTATKYDGLGRVTKIIPTDGSDASNNVQTSYADNCTTITDQAGRSRKSCTDGLGRLTEVREDPAGLNYATYYDYDVLGNLICVKQTGSNTANQLCDGTVPASWRKRTFVYDALSRLTQSNNPESGTINYTYDSDGNVLTKADARPITITYSYDQLHRLTGKTYSDSTPAVTYYYDQTSYNGLATINNPKPNRTGMSDSVSGPEASWSYRPAGLAEKERRAISGVTKEISYAYNLDGSLATLTYPSGRTLSYSYGGAGRLLSAVDNANAINYATGATYTPWGALKHLVNGNTGTFAGIITDNTYNQRMQPITLSSGTQGQGSQTVLSLTYDFHLNGTDNNGNVYGITNNRDPLRSLTGSIAYSYDTLNRIATASTTGTDCTANASGFTKNYGESFTMDAWGNLTAITTTKCTAEGLSVSDSQYKNQMDAYCYDAAGNLTGTKAQSPPYCPGTVLYAYDAEGRLFTAGGVTYTYDADGKRVKKSDGKLYWGSGPFTETDLSGTPTADYIFLGSKRISRLDQQPSPVPHYYFSDFLGSHSVVTNANASAIEQESDNYPFGSERILLAGANQYKFTGKERDPETGLSYFGARYMLSSFGRFLSVDSEPPMLGKPQTLNRYSYALNNPTRLVDPDGNFPTEAHIVWSVQALKDIGFTNINNFARVANRNLDRNSFLQNDFHGIGDSSSFNRVRDSLLARAAGNNGNFAWNAVALVMGMHLVQDRIAHEGLNGIAAHVFRFGLGDADPNSALGKIAQAETKKFSADFLALLAKNFGADADQVLKQIQAAAATLDKEKPTWDSDLIGYMAERTMRIIDGPWGKPMSPIFTGYSCPIGSGNPDCRDDPTSLVEKKMERK